MDRRSFLKTGTLAAAGAAAVTASALPTPAISQGREEWKMVTTWPKNFPGLGTGAQRIADKITTMTDGRITVKLYAAGELVPPIPGSFDAVSDGTADMYHAADYYWVGKHPAFAFFTSVPMGFTAAEIDGWLLHGGGQDLWDELAADFNIKPFPAGNTGVQMGGWFREPIETVDDLQGLKFRMPGLGGEALRRLGVNVVLLPGGEIFPALQSGAIDGTEWVGPWNDLAFGFYRIAKNYYYPGFHEPGGTLSCGVNRQKFEALSDADKAIVQAACVSENSSMYAEYMANNGRALDTLVTQHGVNLLKFPEPIFDAFASASEEVVAEVGQHDALGKKIYDSYMKSRKEIGAWTKVSDEAYTLERTRSLGL